MTTAPKKAGTGSADEAADWLKGVLQERPDQPKIDSSMRLEDFTAAKEAAMRQRGAEIITAFPEDFQPPAAAAPAAGSTAAGSTATPEAAAAAAAAGGGVAADSGAEGGEKYKPKVTTWGVFPRPNNISQAYGGGRNIRPGQELETPEQKAAREAEYAAALQRYKAATFTDSLSEEELKAAQKTFDEASVLFKRGALQQALVLFDEVRAKVPLKSRLGGMSTLQAAVCYDTLGNARQAEALYKRIGGHPTSEVSRKAKALVFGFQAASFLKADTISYAVKKDEYLKYFRRAADRNRMYVASEEERAADQEEAAKAAVVALGVVLGPVVILGALLAGSKLG
ncbi:hypothetical protein OEZ86_007427 [Tetradesmus obliquus]|nr:hypothetical protein OEZ86_007427 [Tetradesmus obliquus]